MHFSGSDWAARCAVAGIISLAGCSGAGSSMGLGGGGPQIPGVSQAGVTSNLIDPGAVIKSGLYVAFDSPASVSEYSANDTKNKGPRCTFSGGAIVGVQAIGVDQAGTLWVPSQNYGFIQPNAYPITSYAPSCGTPGITLEDPNGGPTGIAFDSKGTNYVMDQTSSGAVSVFPKSHTSPSRILSTPISGFGLAIGVDSKDNVYVMYLNSAHTGTVVEFPKGKAPGKTLGVTTSYFPGGTLVFDKSDNMLVNENNVVGYLEIFAPPYNGSPNTFNLKGASWQCALNKLETRLACADYGNNSVDVFSYPSISYYFSVTAGLPSHAGVYGLSYDPAAPN